MQAYEAFVRRKSEMNHYRQMGELAVEDSHEAALMLFGMALGHPHMMRLVGREPSTGAVLRARIDRAVRIFLAGCAA